MFIIKQERSIWDKLKTYEVSHPTNDYTVKMEITENHRRDIGIVHGGATCGLIDRTMKGILIERNFEQAEWRITNSKVSFHTPGKGDYLIATSSILTESQDYKYLLCQVYDSNNNHIATATATATASVLNSNGGGDCFDSLFEFNQGEKNEAIPDHVLKKDLIHPFRDYLHIKRTIWTPKICEMRVQIGEEHREPNGSLPHSLLTMLTDMASGQATRSIMPEKADAFTLELSANSFCNFDKAEQLIIRARVFNGGKIITVKTMIFNEKELCVGAGSATYYIKLNK